MVRNGTDRALPGSGRRRELARYGGLGDAEAQETAEEAVRRAGEGRGVARTRA